MRGVDRVSGGFLVVLFAGVALLCGSLLAVVLSSAPSFSAPRGVRPETTARASSES